MTKVEKHNWVSGDFLRSSKQRKQKTMQSRTQREPKFTQKQSIRWSVRICEYGWLNCWTRKIGTHQELNMWFDATGTFFSRAWELANNCSMLRWLIYNLITMTDHVDRAIKNEDSYLEHQGHNASYLKYENRDLKWKAVVE